MSFTELVTVVWRNRVRVSIGLAGLVLAVFALLFTFSPVFHAAVIQGAIQLFQTLVALLIMLFGASLLWKAAMGNFKKGGGAADGKKK